MARFTPLTDLSSSGQPDTPYRLTGVDLRKLLRRVAAKGLSPEQADTQLQVANRLAVRLLRGIVIAVVGMAFLAVGLFLLRYAWQTNANGQGYGNLTRQTTGTVVALDRHDLRNSRPTYAPVFTYAVAGQTYRVTSELATSPASFSVGESVTVRYDPANPQAGRIDSFANRWLLLLIAAGVGGLLTLIGLFILPNALPKPGPPIGPTPTQFRVVMTQVANGQLTPDEAELELLPEQAARRSRQSPVWMGLFVLFIGLCLFFSLRQIGQSVWLMVNGVRVDGTVVSFIHSNGSGAAPLVRYRVGGQAYDCVGDYDTSPDNRVGDVVPVLYNPAQPAEAKIQSLTVLVSGPLFGLLIVGLFVGLLLYNRVLRRRKTVR